MEKFGQILRQHRQSRGLSLRQLGPRVQFGFTFLSQVERGERRATEELARRCDAALDAQGAIINAYMQEQVGDSEVQRRTVLRALGLLAASPLPLVQWEAMRSGISAAVEHGVSPDDWEEIIGDYGTSYYRMEKDRLAENLRADITVLQCLIPAAEESDRASLFWAISRLSVIVALNMISNGNTLTAGRWWRAAHRYARLSECADSIVFSCAWDVVNGCYDGRSASRVLSVSNGALELINSKKPTAGSCGLLAGRAQALSLAGRHSEAIATVRQLSEAVVALPSSVSGDIDSLWGWPEHRLRHTEAWVYSHARMLPEAERAKDRAVELYPSSLARLRTQVQLHHAAAVIRGGQIPDGLRLAADALDSLPLEQHNELLRAIVQQVAEATPATERRRPAFAELTDRWT